MSSSVVSGGGGLGDVPAEYDSFRDGGTGRFRSGTMDPNPLTGETSGVCVIVRFAFWLTVVII
jgi:hypothetical protein